MKPRFARKKIKFVSRKPPAPSIPKELPAKKRITAPNWKYVCTFAGDVSGNKGAKIVQNIGEGATDETIERATKFKMAEIRSLLNQLHNHGIVEYTREKNMQTGWFTYTWRVNADRALQNFLASKRNEYNSLKQQHEAADRTVLYNCLKGCGQLQFDAAVDAAFRCPKCSSKLKFVDNKKRVRELESRIGAIDKIMGAIV
jgi:transcription factor E